MLPVVDMTMHVVPVWSWLALLLVTSAGAILFAIAEHKPG